MQFFRILFKIQYLGVNSTINHEIINHKFEIL